MSQESKHKAHDAAMLELANRWARQVHMDAHERGALARARKLLMLLPETVDTLNTILNLDALAEKYDNAEE